MKNLKYFFTVTFALVIGGVISSCSKDSDSSDGEGSARPDYRAESAMFTINQSSKYSMIELTESGNYLVVLSNSPYPNYAPSVEQANEYTSILVAPWAEPATRSKTVGNLITGKYTKTDELQYELEGFGSLKVVKTDENNVVLDIKETDGTSFSLPATIVEKYEGSTNTTGLCRTWTIQNTHLKARMEFQGEKFSFEKTVNGGDIPTLMISMYTDLYKWAASISSKMGQTITQDQVNYMIQEQTEKIKASVPVASSILFSQAGTYIVFYANDTFGVAKWNWINEDETTIRYAWDRIYGTNQSTNVSGNCDVALSGKQCKLIESKSQYNENGMIESTTTYTLVE